MYCPKCGKQNDQGALFCAKCGYAFGTAGQPQQSAQRQQPVMHQQDPQMQQSRPMPQQHDPRMQQSRPMSQQQQPQVQQRQPVQQRQDPNMQYRQPPPQNQDQQNQDQQQFRRSTASSAEELARASKGFFKQFITGPATAIESGRASFSVAAVFSALLPISIFLMLFSFVHSFFGDVAGGTRSEINDVFSFGAGFLHTALHTGVWLLILIIFPLLVLKLMGNKSNISIKSIFSLVGLVTIPYSLFYLLTAILAFFNMWAMFLIMIAAGMAFATLAPMLLHVVATRKAFNVSVEKAVCSTIVTYLVATAYGLFGAWRVLLALGGQLTDYLLNYIF